MSDNTGGGRRPEPEDAKRPAQQTDESHGGAIKQAQKGRDVARDISRGAEPPTAGSARQR